MNNFILCRKSRFSGMEISWREFTLQNFCILQKGINRFTRVQHLKS